MHGDAVSVATAVLARLAEERSARFVSWLSAGDAEPGDDQLSASGTTDFVTLETRTRQRGLPPSRMRGITADAREQGLLSRVIVGGAFRWLERSGGSTDFQDHFYTAGRCWKQSAPDSWRPWFRNAPDRPGRRAGLDPTLVLETIPALSVIDAQRPADLHGCPAELVEGRADLRRVEDRLQGLLKVGSIQTPATKDAPLRLWIDTTGLLRRVSCSWFPPEPRDSPRLWRTLGLRNASRASPLLRLRLPPRSTRSIREPLIFGVTVA